MSDTPKPGADGLLQQADALMRRHRRVFVAGGEVTVAPQDDVPVLTEVVDDELMAQPAQVGEAEMRARIHAAVNANDAELANALERWIATQLPHVLSQALGSVAEQLERDIGDRLRAELLVRPMFEEPEQ